MAHPDPSVKTNCSPNSGRVIPVIDRNRCEGKAECEIVCPYEVFSVKKIGAEERAQLSLRGRFKAFFHGGKQAFVTHADACHACGLCVNACPEKAIRLVAQPT
jgi:4Fe-4S ferredoxin